MEIAVCDDNKLMLDTIEAQLQTLDMVDNIFTFSNLDAFLFSIDSGRRYDAVLMDIEWGEKVTGMDAAAELYKLCPETKIIYVTGHVELFSQQIFLHRANLSGFLTKPVDIALLRANLQKIVDSASLGVQPALVLRQKGLPVSIPLREIYFIESKGHTVNVHTAEGVVTAYERLENIKGALGAGFYQCHKSYVVNMNQIRRFGAGDVLLKNGEQVPVSRARYVETKDAYFSYMGQQF
ncbi:MAG: LytTR family DNA-binding domain-containing protein [Defluviitaleaceae bacterium]|nr:LytTR family DNA-binding domain-containing protein [Defluviitaleaceae bacterium]